MYPARYNKASKLGDMNHCDAADEPVLLAMEAPKASVLSPLQVQSHGQGNQNRLARQRIHLVPATEEPIANLDTALLFAARQRESKRQREDMFISAMAEDIARLSTLQLPIIALPAELQTKSDRRQIIASAAGAVIAGAGDLISAVLRFATNVVMTNLVSQSIYGIYAAVYTAALLAASIAGLGLDNATLRFLSTYRARGEHELAAGLVRFVMWMVLISGLLCGALFYLVSMALAHLIYHQERYTLPLKEAALLVPFMALQLVLASGLQALKSITWKVYTDRLIQPGLTLALVGIFYMLGLRLEALMLATICGFIASVMTGQVLLRKATRRFIRNVVPRFEPKTWLRFALPMSFNSMILNILASTDVLFLAAFATAAQVGLYAAPDRASLLVTMPLLALNVIFSPLIAEYYARGEHEQLASLSKVVTKWAFSLSWPLFLCFCIFHEAILSIFSRGYTAAGMVLIILSFGNLVDAGVGSVWTLLAMTGHARVILINTVVTIIVNIGLAFWLVPRYNLIGAAVASTLAVIMLNIAGFIEVYCILKILTLRRDMLKPVAAGVGASMIGLLLLRVIHVGYGYRAILGVLGLVIPFMLVYGLILVLLRFSKEDRAIFEAVRVKFGKKQSA